MSEPTVLSPPGVIYAICDDRNRVRYIGKATHYKVRVSNHRNDLRRGIHKNPYLQNWYDKLVRRGHRPRYRILQECLPGTIDECECEWIARGRAKGWKLCNLTDGGEGGAWDEAAKQRQSELNRRKWQDPEYQRHHEEHRAARAGLTVEQYRERTAERERTRQANREQHQANMRKSAERKAAKLLPPTLVPLTHQGSVFVPLTRGLWAVIDVEDWPNAEGRAWYAQPHQGHYRAVANRGSGKVFLKQITIKRAKPLRLYPNVVDCRRRDSTPTRTPRAARPFDLAHARWTLQGMSDALSRRPGDAALQASKAGLERRIDAFIRPASAACYE